MSTVEPPPSSFWRSLGSGLLSVLFWLFLLTAGALYAGVALSPKLIAWQAWDRQYQANQLELVALESRSTQLEQVVTALKDDPQFAAEIVRIEFDAQAPGEEVLPVSGRLVYDPRTTEPVDQPRPVKTRQPPWQVWLMTLATDQPLRRGLLTTAAALVVVGFTFLHDRRSPRGRSMWHALRQRYHNPS